ncbi:50S ribosomal protein L11 methyltransferase [Desulfuromonas sp. KJ2020]|uniref:50S ribosomal protein L11 methyltransferase n=1 Tax=Desulfuromonas sp. KJ2020 TaxID=2919173 RepID=UPI0020A6E211|nr:50S ribosomal protein L11 methyltransferase [Desulfuromonas sp. KJ2020]MCP3176438.1 50S ribosomal protein L11 methyltransferase [Desulfuromonas sp. KJ2020]
MKKTWLEIRIPVPAAGIDLVCGELMELGCEGITVEERPLDTFVPPDPDEILAEEQVIKAYFPAGEDTSSLCRAIQERLEELRPFVPGLVAALPAAFPVRTEDWAQNWKQHFQAVRIGRRLVIKPTWEDFNPEPDDVIVQLDPGMAFGTGTHGTTRLCLEALAALFEGEHPPRRVLDVGTGSGILAIAAAALGADRVLACDIEEEACRTARANAELNGVEERIEVTGEPLEGLEGGFDLVLANILAEENIRLASELISRLNSGGALILSGILQEKEPAVVEAFAAYPLSSPHITHLEEWSCLLYHKGV